MRTAIALMVCLVPVCCALGGCRRAEPRSAESIARSRAAQAPAAAADRASADAQPAAPPATVPAQDEPPPSQPASKAARGTDAVSPPSPPALSVSPEQIAAAKQLAADLGVVMKEDADGNVILLDTAAKRSWVDDNQLQEILVFPRLESLTVEGPSITHMLAPQMARLSALSSLAMRNTLITNEGLAELKGLRSLKVIDLRLSPLLTDAALDILADMPQLRAVRLSGVNITDRGVAALLKLPELNELDVRNCRGVTQAGIGQLVGKQSLRSLKVGGMAIDDEALRVVGRMVQLNTLSVDNCAITDAGVAQLGDLPLVNLTIYQCTNVTDDGLKVLVSLADLRSLTLRDIKAQGAALTQLPCPEKLAELNMAQSGITDAEVPNLARFSRLEDLTLSETAITDAAVDTLSKLASLKSLTMTQTRMSDAGIARLTASLPNCRVRTY
jgi:Leucine-rich repeat (LRR) protein